MPPNLHTEIPTGEYADASTFNLRLGQLGMTVGEFLRGRPLAQGRLDIDHGSVTIGDDNEVYVGYTANGLNRRWATLVIDTRAMAAGDDLYSIFFDPEDAPGPDETVTVILTNLNASRQINVHDGAGNIELVGGGFLSLHNAKRTLQLFYNPNTETWVETGQASIPTDPEFLVPWTTLGSDQAIDETSIPQTSSHMLIVARLIRDPLDSNDFRVRFNSNNTGYRYLKQMHSGTSPNLNTYFNAVTAGVHIEWRSTGDYAAILRMVVKNYTSSLVKTFQSVSYDFDDGLVLHQMQIDNGVWSKSPAEPITRVTIGDTSSGVVQAGSSYAIMGLK